MKLPRVLLPLLPSFALALAVPVLGPASARAVTISFDTNADFDENFYKNPAQANASFLTRDAGGYLLESGAGGGHNTSAIYNTTTTGGSGGSGGTALGSPIDTFSDFVIEADFQMSVLNSGNSIGFFTNLNSTGTQGYGIILRLFDGSGNADVRLFSTGNATTSSVSGLSSTGILGATAGLGLQTNTWYTYQLTVTDDGTNIDFTARLFAQGGAQIGSTLNFSAPISGATEVGQVGFRLSTVSNQNTLLDNFAINPVPEPSAAALSFLSAAGLCVFRRRHRMNG